MLMEHKRKQKKENMAEDNLFYPQKSCPLQLVSLFHQTYFKTSDLMILACHVCFNLNFKVTFMRKAQLILTYFKALM